MGIRCKEQELNLTAVVVDGIIEEVETLTGQLEMTAGIEVKSALNAA
jgi:hypothetical protein